MKNLIISFFMIFIAVIQANSQSRCDKECLKELSRGVDFIQFIYTPLTMSEPFKSYYAGIKKLATIPEIEIGRKDIKVALIIPQDVIKSYSVVVSDSVFAYIFKRDVGSHIEIFYSGNESAENLNLAINRAKNAGFKYLIAPLTTNGLEIVNSDDYDDLIFYIPTINIKNISNPRSNLFFGGIDYEAQIQKLLTKANHKITAFGDGSRVSDMLNNLVANNTNEPYIKNIEGSDIKLNFLKNNYKVKNSSIFLNTPLIKSALLSSQFRVFELTPHILLSTQLNYNSALISLTQSGDRKNMYIANSIMTPDSQLETLSAILGEKLDYDWVAYSTMIGMDFIYLNYINKSAKAIFKEEMQNNQIQYNINIMRAGNYGFYFDE
ncbi:Putative periplasmic protein [Campylobacter devanensis]|uniref:Uncharacterized protein n=1 Tax=Campylobacter devanensis TaxID=3161138 RepID=A0A1X9SRJ1_9BACT|nr:hypothetical protein [Campylobacter lanienae]ARQ98869.1 hypothetical protein CIGN_0572 [Campylobacter lanienae]SUX01936.1 Putative periplasmic protein [Campylobacter lanienae]